MFGWFKKKPAPQPTVDLPDLDLDLDGPRKRKRDQWWEDPPDPEQRAKERMVLVCRQAQLMIQLEMYATKQTLSPEEQHQKMLFKALELFQQQNLLAHISDEMAYSRQHMSETVGNNMEEIKQALDQIPKHTSVDQLVDIWRQHPALVGWFAPDIIRSVSKALQR